MWIRIRAVIIEDEPLAAQYLAELLDDTCQVRIGKHAAVNSNRTRHSLRRSKPAFSLLLLLGSLAHDRRLRSNFI